MWELEHKESWAPKNWCFLIVVLEKTLESPLNYKEIKPVRPKGDQSWIFIGRTDAEAEAPILWPPNAFWKTLMLGKIEGKRRREQQRMRWLDGITEPMDMSKLRKTEESGVLQSMGLKRLGHDLVSEQQQQNNTIYIWQTKLTIKINKKGIP